MTFCFSFSWWRAQTPLVWYIAHAYDMHFTFIPLMSRPMQYGILIWLLTTTFPINALEWINSIATYNEQMRNRNRSFQPDPLLFPSTWKPLKLFTALAVFRVVTAHGMESACGCLIMRQYILHLVAYDEWYRILMREKRIALASFVHTASFLAACCQLSTAVFSQSRLAPTLLAPVLLASLFSWWMK